MGSFRVDVKPAATKELEALPDHILNRVIQKLEALGETPRPVGCKKLKGYKDLWRARVGAWRIVYSIDDSSGIVSVTRVAHRREAYE